jgi:hypothetical protein
MGRQGGKKRAGGKYAWRRGRALPGMTPLSENRVKNLRAPRVAYDRGVSATEPDPLLSFAARPPLAETLRPHPLVAGALLLALAAGALLGFVATGAPAFRLVRGIFFAAAFAYLVLSLLDFWEHFRLERAATGRWWAMQVLPPGETLNHTATGLVIVALFVLARPLPSRLMWRDWFVLASPALFLLLGWRDELVYHRRRCAHREDIMHTVAHLAAGVMMCSFLSTRLFSW